MDHTPKPGQFVSWRNTADFKKKKKKGFANMWEQKSIRGKAKFEAHDSGLQL